VSIKTAGELRAFLADILVNIKSGDVTVEEATAISKVAGAINQSLAVEAKMAIELQKMGEKGHVAGSMQIASGNVDAITAQDAWCDQCEARVSASDAATCKSKFCKLRAEAA
jgi:hypothetical protein